MTLKTQKRIIWTASIVVPLLVAILLNPRGPKISLGADFDTYIFPKINAAINSMVSILLVIGLVFIKQKKVKAHRNTMIAAFTLSALFLVSYVLYHVSTPHTGWCEASPIGKGPYLIILASHIILSVFIVPLASFSIFFGINELYQKHKRLVRFAYPIWLYVSITGVLVYFLISPCYG